MINMTAIEIIAQTVAVLACGALIIFVLLSLTGESEARPLRANEIQILMVEKEHARCYVLLNDNAIGDINLISCVAKN